MPLAQRHPQFHAGQMRAQAAMDAPAEGNMPVHLAVEAHRVGILDLVVIGVGRAHMRITEWPRLTGQPPNVVSSRAARATSITGVSQRRSSSIADGMTPGSSTSCRRCSGCCAKKLNMQSNVAVTVSRPAMRKRKQMSKMSSRESVAPSTSALMNRDDQIVPRCCSPLVEHLVEVVVDGVGHLLLMGLRRRTPLSRPRDVTGADDPVLHGQEPIEFVERKSEQREEDLRRKGHGELPPRSRPLLCRRNDRSDR